jgi:DNA-binding beta-propeller fold protein YncE
MAIRRCPRNPDFFAIVSRVTIGLALALIACQSTPVFYGGYQGENRFLAEPSSVAIGANDEIFVLESLTSRVRVFAQGREVRSFGARGSKPGELLEPRGLALAPDGEVYISDTGNDRVQVFSDEGRFLRNFGIRGTGPSEFNQPLGLAVDASRVFVADSRNHRVQVFLRDGRYATEYGRFGRGDGELDHPSDVAVDSEWNAYVADADNQRIAVFDRRGDFVRNFGGFGPYAGLFMTPSGIRIHGDRLFVADRDNHRIETYDLKGELLHEFGVHALRPREGEGKLHYPNQVAIAPSGRFAAVVEAFENRLQIFGPETEQSAVLQQTQEKTTGSHFGAAIACAGPTMVLLEPSAPALLAWDVAGDEPIEISRYGHFGPKSGELVRPEGIAIDRDAGRAYVSDPGQGRLSVYGIARPAEPGLRYMPELVRFVKSLDFRALWESERPAKSTAWPIEPGAVAVGPSGDLWVIDEANARLVVLDRKLTVLRSIGGGRSADARLFRPTDLALSPSGEIVYVVDAAEGRVKAFDASGKPLFAFGHTGTGPTDFVRPFGIAVSPDADVYVTDEGGNKVLRFDAVGRLRSGFGCGGLGRVEFFKPRGTAFDARGRLIVLDWGNHRGQVLTRDGEFIQAFGSRIFIQPTLKRP